jgi:tRNA (mo5U34)-methyltransferase
VYATLSSIKADVWANLLPSQLEQAFDAGKHGDLARWCCNLSQLPTVISPTCQWDSPAIAVGSADDLTAVQQQQLLQALQGLHPWRKGPYQLFGLYLDTEWRSDWKWQRLQSHITPLQNRTVLDIGCGNGYHCWRMLGAGAKVVIGIEPMLLNVMQFLAVKQLMANNALPIHVLPLGIEQLPFGLQAFDTVFSMGVLYHRRSPLDHLLELRSSLRPGGELVLETLVIDGALGDTLVPEGRYAQMRNVWFLPSCDTLASWLKRCGFQHIRLVDVTTTSTEEQRTTPWMRFHSLQDFLNINNPHLTVEGLPAPKRAIFVANA